jgi:CubicO group peptidase (beta-lactamase class C family)
MNIRFTAFLFAFTTFAQCNVPITKNVFPAREWKKEDPEKLGLNMETLAQIDSLMKQAEANGAIVRNGYLVAEFNYGGPSDKTFEVQSITKSMTGIVLGLALKEKRIPNLDAKVIEYFPGFNAGPYTNEITFRHLVTASSGIKSTITKGRYYDPDNMKPGIESRYHNDHCYQLALALTYIYGKDLAEVIREKVLTPLMAQDSLKWGKHGSVVCADGREVPVAAGYAFVHVTARDLARLGLLFLNNGLWKEEQILPHDYVVESRTPIPIPVMDTSPDAPPGRESGSKYGLAWRGRPSGKDKILWHMSGNGGQFCVVMPEYNLVMTKINSYKEKPYTEIGKFEKLLWDLVKENRQTE